MKTSIVAYAAILIAAAATNVVSAENCDIEQLKPLFTNTDIVVCTEDSGFSLVPSVKPSPGVVTKLCASAACQRMLMTLKSLRMGDCTLLDIQLETDLLTPATSACANSTNTSKSIEGGSGDKPSEDTESIEQPVATEDSTTDVAPGTTSTVKISNTVDSQTSASGSITDSAMATTDSAVSSVSSSVGMRTVATVVTVVVATLVLEL